MAETENVKVAVRVRPFNKREKERKAKLCVQMNGKITTVTDPQTNKPKSFTYDYSYWSFDGSKETANGYFEQDLSHPNGQKYCDQKRVYEDVGKGVMKNAWAGYNATLFAYGQTGSGKSWSVIGYGSNKGIVPLLTEELFEGIKNNKEPKQFEVRFSMLEIYNEIARDLLAKTQDKTGLKIRQHPKKGFYAEGLRKPLVMSHEEIAAKMEEGTVNRTIRLTNMNATSSRAHTIVSITFIQKFQNARGQETAKTAVINLVDLAGSERVESTGATGDRLKEGAGINLSLTSLGNVINALVKKSKGESARIPYRDSTLTKLLKNALGGNSKTIMIAAISPADINFDETVSTLNFADRAKQIQTKAVVNEDPTEKLIRELKEENDRLKKSMKSGKIDADFVDEDGDGIDDRDAARLRAKWEEEMKARMMENDTEVQNLRRNYEDLLAKKDHVDPSLKKKTEDKNRKPHIYNLNSDPQLTGRVFYILKPGDNTVGNRKGKATTITMDGTSVQSEHAVLKVDKNGAVTLANNAADNRTMVNGDQITGTVTLEHNDRILFGVTQFWVFCNPLQKKKSKKYPEITYEFAQEEIMAKSGIKVESNGLESEAAVAELQEGLLELMPAIEEANSISAELDRKAKFEILIPRPDVVGKSSELMVKVKNLENGSEYVWKKQQFMDRLFKMREIHNDYLEKEDEDISLYTGEEDMDGNPFVESLDTEVLIGTVNIPTSFLAQLVEIKQDFVIIGLSIKEVGTMSAEIVPCNKAGREYTESDDVFVDEPESLIGNDLYFKLKINSCRGLPSRYTDIYCAYKFYLDKNERKTSSVRDTSNPNFNYVEKISYRPVTKQLVDYLKKSSVVVEVRGKQRLRRSAIPMNKGMSTRELLKNDKSVLNQSALLNRNQMNGQIADPQKQSLLVELLLMKKTQARLQQRCDNVAKLIKEAENTSRLRVSTTLLREVMNASSGEQANALIQKKLAEHSDSQNDGSSSSQKSSFCTIQ